MPYQPEYSTTQKPKSVGYAIAGIIIILCIGLSYAIAAKIIEIDIQFNSDNVPFQKEELRLGNDIEFPGGPNDFKPVIYLYPTTTQRTNVTLSYAGELFVTYPPYREGWNVIAEPDGTLMNVADGREYSYLFWEGIDPAATYDLSTGDVVAGRDTARYLQETLSAMGLTPREYNEFIVFWLPQMQDNPYNLIHFATHEEYHDRARLDITPTPTSMLRIFMVFTPLSAPIDVIAQQIEPFERQGFTVVEWGGTEISS